jgi:hypothetical protein
MAVFKDTEKAPKYATIKGGLKGTMVANLPNRFQWAEAGTVRAKIGSGDPREFQL